MKYYFRLGVFLLELCHEEGGVGPLGVTAAECSS